MDTSLKNARDAFVHQWGALGSQWGVNRTMAMIHALLLVAVEPLDTDAIMAELQISRGNANTNLRELVGWGLVTKVVRPGERREFFAAEKEVWKIFCVVARERKRRETEPAQQVLASCIEQSAGLDTPEAREFNRQLRALADFVELANTLMEKIATKDQSTLLPRLLKVLG
jgi:DNA-binding transcriptional regulator GbsR (MarR family)